MTEMTGGEAVTETLLRHGVTTIYGLPGVQSDHLFNAFHDAGSKLSVVHTRHEQGAAYMALGAALATGRPAVYSVVPGPGFLNSAAALSTAFATNAPVLALVGQIPSAAIGKGFGLLHEIPDQSAALGQLTKWSTLARSPQQAATGVAEAWQAMISGRPRPAGLELPPDMLGQRAHVTLPDVMPPAPPPEPDGAMLEQAATLLMRAERPLIAVGSGAIAAAADVVRLSELLGAPVFANRNGRGIVDDRHDLSHVAAGGHAMWRDADVVLAVGSRLQVPLQAWGGDARLKIIRLDIDPTELERYAPSEIAIACDARRAISLLIDMVKTPHPEAARRREASRAIKAGIAAEFANIEPQLSYLRAIRDALPDDGVLVEELTQVGYAARFGYEVRRPRTLLSPGYQGTLGWGVPTALGAKHALGKIPVVSIAGDGGFMFNVQELASAVRHRIPVVFIVFNDNAYGNVRRIQRQNHDNRLIASDLVNPDFLKLADSFGIAGARVRDPAALRTALDRALAADEPTLIEVPFEEMPSPWRFINMPRVRGN
jgi:acetolactate synthase-1/2/3 large subunit